MNFNITVDSKIAIVNATMSILQACESVQIMIPRFCYHERLSIAGNCRMCLVELEKAPKLVVACAMPVAPNMIIKTKSFAVLKAREGVLEFLLVNHPLDCAICDQGGECDLQDQTIIFGGDRGRFREHKRAIEDKQCGPLIKTIMTRCIHCTRCIRFSNEIIGLTDLGSSGRGNGIEISLYIKKLFKSEFSGNLIDLCPVGALTSKPFNFTARPWEFKSIESIDIGDAIGSNIRIDVKGYEILRVLPRLNEKINEEWISDKTRFSFDGLKKRRVFNPLLKNHQKKWVQIPWAEAFCLLSEHLYLSKTDTKSRAGVIAAFVGPHSDLESIMLLQQLLYNLKGFFDQKRYLAICDFEYKYKFNTTISLINKANGCLLLGVNTRLEGGLINMKLRKRYISLGLANTIVFGSFAHFTFPVYHLGSTTKSLILFIEGRHKFSKIFTKSSTPLIIIGKSLFGFLGVKTTEFAVDVLINNTKSKILNNWASVNLFQNEASEHNLYAMGLAQTNYFYYSHKQLKNAYPQKSTKATIAYQIGNFNVSKFVQTGCKFSIYQGSFLTEAILQNCNLILPAPTFAEAKLGFLNIEGRFQTTNEAFNQPFGLMVTKETFAFLLDYYAYCRSNKTKIPNLTELTPGFFNLYSFSMNKQMSTPHFINKKPLARILLKNKHSFMPSSVIENFYISDILNESSPTMGRCTKFLLDKSVFISNFK